jgi:hypothetical protein
MAMACTINPNFSDPTDAAIDEIVASCNGDMRGAVKALLLVNEQLESELNRLSQSGGSRLANRTSRKRLAALTFVAAIAAVDCSTIRMISRKATGSLSGQTPDS